MQERTLYAVFIGIDAYPLGALSGCVKDVLDMDLLLREQCAQQSGLQYKPLYFLAPNAADEIRIAEYRQAKELELPFLKPGYDNLRNKAFAHFETARSGDICLFYYSGHGSQTDAPAVFHHAKPDGQNETIVCVDSRDPAAPDARDLVDKELAYLIWKAFHGKDVHALVIMDCCHSGNNTRSLKNETDVQFRYQPAAGDTIPFEAYLGYGDNAFYTIQNGNATFAIPRYVHLAACRDNEKAQETMNGGLFTVKLVEALRAGGTSRSYRSLMQNLAITVRNRAEMQNPVAFAQHDPDLDQQFLSGDILPFKPAFDVRFNSRDKIWKLYGGAIHGLTPATRMRVKDKGITADVSLTSVFPATSLPDNTAMGAFDTGSSNVTAMVLQPAEQIMKVAVTVDDPVKRTALKEAYTQRAYPFFNLSFEPNPPGAQYLAQLAADGKFILTRINGNMPLFRREGAPDVFLEQVNKVGNWLTALELKHADPLFTKDDLIFSWEIVEGYDLENTDPETIRCEAAARPPEEEVVLSYRNNYYPAFRLRIMALKPCFIKTLYLGSKFGVNTSLIRDDENRLGSMDSIPLRLTAGEYSSVTIPVAIDENYTWYHVNEVTDFLKIIVSSVAINVDAYQQDGLELDVPEDNRDLAIPGRSGRASDQPQWSVFTFPIRCIGPQKEQRLEAGGTTDFTAFRIEAPEGFTAMACAVTADEINTRGEEPSLHIWGANMTAPLFESDPNPAANNSIQALELYPEKEGGPLQLPQGKVLIIRPRATRSLDEEGIVIPYGFDTALQLYVPLGYADDAGNIYIEQLPPASAGGMQQTRSIGSSVKLFFKKIFRPKTVNQLGVYAWKDNSWQKQDGQPLKPGGKAVLLIHGIIGDTRYMSEVFRKQASGLDYLLTYDYENLATPIADTAAALHKALQQVGFGSKGMPELTIVAHSMGGLVARWLVEMLPEVKYVSRLILVGSPCAGSEMAALTTSAFGMLAQAMNITGPVKYAISGLAFLLKQLKLYPGKTLTELQPGSKLLQDLALSNMAPGVDYRIVGGDTGLLKTYTGDDGFLKRIATMLKDDVLYPGLSISLYHKEPNDMAVTLKSMRSILQLNEAAQMHVVPSNHLAYFREQPSMDKLLTLLT